MAGNAGKGRIAGSRNRRTEALLSLTEEGETPCGFAIRIMRDEGQPNDLRLHAAKLAAPYIHSKPQPEPRVIGFELPAQIDGSEGLLAVHEAVLRACASGELALDDARDLSGMLEAHRRLVETLDLEQRIARLEQAQAK